jgi:class 3 adenylate cyclase
MSSWRARQAEESRSPDEYRSVAEQILAHGEPLLAYDVIHEGLIKWPQDTRLRQLQGLALARSGATERANAVLEELRQSGESDEETLGMLARTHKDLASRTTLAKERDEHLRRASEAYLQAFENTGGYWSGINAATMTLLQGQQRRATELAKQVQTGCQQLLSRGDSDQYWILAALGEAALISRDWGEAEQWYRRAAKQAGRRFADLSSTRRNARLILQYWNEDPAKIDTFLAIPRVIVFTGHMIDAPNRMPPRFPPLLESAVASALQERIETLRPGLGFASAACGSDILFLEAMLNVGAEFTIVLPYNKDEFVRDSVDFLPDSNWPARFERVLQHATQCVVASTHKFALGSVSYDFGNALLFGLATIYARRLETSLVPLAVWDGICGDGPGGTATAVEHWRAHGYRPEIIDLTQFSLGLSKFDKPGTRDETRGVVQSKESNVFPSRVVAVLFADAVGFSKLTEDEVPRFVQHFLGAIANLTGKFAKHVVAKNTWGDGLYVVLSDVCSAGEFALQLAHLVCSTDWQRKGLPPGLNVRIALHAGPVYQFDDPITGNRSYGGTHVSRAARIEPITPAGHVYASESFAALAAARDEESFVCDYVGQTPLAKAYGTMPMYHVRWRSGTAH